MRRLLLPVLLLSSLLLASDPWTPKQLIQPQDLAAHLKGPLIIQVGFDVLYRAAHIPGSLYAGPATAPGGMAKLKQAVAGQPKNREIVLYCGCCPFDHCPNIRPAFAALHEAGFTNVKVMMVPQNLKVDWIDKGYPTEVRR